MALTENDDRGLEMAMLNRELIDEMAGAMREENQDLRDRVAWLEAAAEVGHVSARAIAAELVALRSLLLLALRRAS